VTSKPQKTKATAKPTAKPSKTVGQEEEDSSEMTSESQELQKDFETDTKELTIEAGDWSDQVSRNLEELDIISDASAFDTYLEQNGYSDDIKAGTFEISMDATFEEIAKEITSKQ
jgi:cell division protein YceG involved in septum cleavage